MLYSVNDDLRGFLLAQPESGMGYQLLERDDGEDRLLILNAELGVSVKAMHELASKRDHRGQLAVVDQSLPVLAISPQSVKVITHGSYPSQTRAHERFIRYSAFQHDRRIRADNSVVSGTYVTTESDAVHWWRSPYIWSGLAVVGRYALPNPAPAIYSFMMKPPPGFPITCGTVTPKYGQSGGGVEIRLEADTPPHTVVRKTTIRDR